MKKHTYIFLLSAISTTAISQTAQIKGVVLNEQDLPVKNVLVQTQNKQVFTNENGFYFIEVTPSTNINIKFEAEHYQPITYIESLEENQSFELNIRLHPTSEELQELVIDKNLRQRFEGTTIISPDVIRRIPGAMQVLKTL